jgi:uncharacterized protein (TIGR00730 family)
MVDESGNAFEATDNGEADAFAQAGGPLKAYEDLAFLRSSDARIIRVIAELMEPQFRLERKGITDTVVFFGSARMRANADTVEHPGLRALSRYYEDARELAYRITKWNQERPDDRQFVVCSGAGPGIMEAASRGARDAGGESIGFGISIAEEQGVNPYVTPELAWEFHYFFLRKFWFLYNAKALVYFPGGFGTMDEMMEALTLLQTQKIRKRMGMLLFGADYWNSVLNLDAMVEHGVISVEDRDLFIIVDDVDDAFTHICTFLEENYGPSLLDEH